MNDLIKKFSLSDLNFTDFDKNHFEKTSRDEFNNLSLKTPRDKQVQSLIKNLKRPNYLNFSKQNKI